MKRRSQIAKGDSRLLIKVPHKASTIEQRLERLGADCKGQKRYIAQVWAEVEAGTFAIRCQSEQVVKVAASHSYKAHL